MLKKLFNNKKFIFIFTFTVEFILYYFFEHMPFGGEYIIADVGIAPVFGMMFGPIGGLGQALASLTWQLFEGADPTAALIDFTIMFFISVLAYKLWYTTFKEKTINTPKRLEQQAWHFSMWGDEQLEKLKEGFNELSLVEYGEQWRTNLVKQIKKNDVIMLFRRGGYGYIGAYQAVGWRVFNFEENQEEILMFGKDSQIIEGEQYLSDIKKYDIYKSCDDGATSCTNIIVAPIAFVEDGVGNPGGVYRRTISRYDPHYAWLLKNEFQKTGQWLDR